MKRIEFTAKIKAEAAIRANGYCERCTCKLMAGHIEFDHVIPLAVGGESNLANCACVCTNCHKGKTRRDQADIGKARRRERKHIGIRKAQCRPMPGTKRSGIRKRMNGTVERW
jgi:5-methylcytosine-specific restriction endonuclease McrA